MTELYSLRSIPQARLQRFTSFEIRKFDEDFNCLATYTTSPNSCTCARGETGKRCRHQEMLNTLITHKDDGWFYNKDTRQWHRPILEPTLEEQVIGASDGDGGTLPYTEETCPGHAASDDDVKVCKYCGVHVNSFYPDEYDGGHAGREQPSKCRYCQRDLTTPCRSTREIEERTYDPICDAALMKAGGGEYTNNQIRALEGECAVGSSSPTPAPEAATPTKMEQTPSPSPANRRYLRR